MIRELKATELSKLLDLYSHLHESDDLLPEINKVEQLWDTIQKNQDLKYFGVFNGDELISSCTLSTIPNLTRGCRPYGVIENVVTHPRHRRKGFGKAVLQHALTESWAADCYKVMLLTGRRDEGTYKFYESAGFDRDAKQAFVAKTNKKDE